ncbi:unnamed protein product [Dibothriocephalus latus]|uniref:Uncharacterized protein n=1 Tax=Dibothriocephalus latus TaxID=60516 RepID=A0A3P7LCR6_DIBLA|nr:unnamed protein product [Dibothriocephalus latus]
MISLLMSIDVIGVDEDLEAESETGVGEAGGLCTDGPGDWNSSFLRDCAHAGGCLGRIAASNGRSIHRIPLGLLF